MQQVYKQLYRMGFIAYGILFILSLLFYKERTVFVDIAFHIFSILVHDGFAIQNFRYGAAATQIFPLLAGKLSLPLDQVMIIYSAGFIVYYTFCYWLCGSVLKNCRAALVLLLCQTLFVSHTFYWMQSELPQAIAFMMVALAYFSGLRIRELKLVDIILISACIVLLNFFHPVLFIPFFFSIAFLFIDRTYIKDKRIIYLVLVLYIIVYFLKKNMLTITYDNNVSTRLIYFDLLFPNYFGLASNRRFLAACTETYYWIPITGSIIGLVYMFQKRWLHAMLVAVFFIGYFLLVNVSYPHATETKFYIENLYLPLGIFLAFPIIYHVFPLLESKKKLLWFFFAGILITACSRIYHTHDMYTQRLNWERKYIAENIDKKLLVDHHKVPMDTLQMTWGTPYEFWLLSTAEYGRTASIIVTDSTNNYIERHWESSSFITTWGTYNYMQLPQKYFVFNDTINNYTLVK